MPPTELDRARIQPTRSMLFYKRSGGPGVHFWRCGCCGNDTELREAPALLLQMGNRVLGLVCESCKREVSERLSALYGVRSFPDLDAAGNLLGDF